MSVENPSGKRLVILTTHFGNNFSGGSSATHDIFVRLQDQFEEIIVICNVVGQYDFRSLRLEIYKNFWHAIRILRKYKDGRIIFYGDFYNSILFVWLKKPFYFTYHDNWPEMAVVSLKDRVRSLFYIPVYRSIFKHAKTVITVSEYKKKYIASNARDVRIIRNGFNHGQVFDERTDKSDVKIIMVGNIEKRKYKLANSLFSLLNFNCPFEIHIYGNINDRTLAEQLESYRFVQLMGFRESIPFQEYTCFLHTSLAENLPIAICESLYNQVPVIAFDVGGIHEIVNKTNGVLIYPYKLNLMVATLLKIIERKIRFSFKNNDLHEFDWTTASECYINVLK